MDGNKKPMDVDPSDELQNTLYLVVRVWYSLFRTPLFVVLQEKNSIKNKGVIQKRGWAFNIYDTCMIIT